MIFTIDGNIGAGKSTIVELLGKHVNHSIVVPEPIESWIPFLEDVYQGDKSVFPFQVRVWVDRAWSPDLTGYDGKSSCVWIERSPYFTSEVFLPVNKTRMESKEYQLLTDMYELSSRSWAPDKMIYLRSSPEEAYKRILTRGRDCEMKMEMDYLRNLHGLHEAAWEKRKRDILIVDVDNKTPDDIVNEILLQVRL